MVLYKRKPVQNLAPPPIENDETEVWEIKQTGEIFLDYASYLARMEFYKKRHFICRNTGRSGLNYFAALKSELVGAQEVDESFPEALKGPILRRIQFQTLSRIDNLVELIYNEFCTDYYPGESVIIHAATGEKLRGIVRDKSSFGPRVLPNGTSHPPFSRYSVTLENKPEDEVVVEDALISRDRKIFTKQILRSFIKETVTREHWTGAPWLVRLEFATKYHIDTRIPPHLRQQSKNTEKKSMNNQPIGSHSNDETVGTSFKGNSASDQQELERQLTAKSKKAKLMHQPFKIQQNATFLNPTPQACFNPTISHQSPYISHTFQAVPSPTQAIPHSSNFHNSTFTIVPLPLSNQNLQSVPPSVKHSIEDLQVPPRFEGPKRPPLKFLSADNPNSPCKPGLEGNEISMKSVGLFLESWDTLNVYCEVFILDSFTFDDFVQAMQYSCADVECQLFVEIHCSVLKSLVESEADGGNILAQLPDLKSQQDVDEESGEISSSSQEPEPNPLRRYTRSSLVKPCLPSEFQKKHRADEMQSGLTWIDRLRKRDFKNGGWQIIIVGLLLQLSKSPRYFDTCETLLKELAPANLEPTADTARQQYNRLNVNLRIQVLQILCMLAIDTKAIRTYMEECNEQMTILRKEKIQWQRDRKKYLEKLRMLNEERKIQLPSNLPSSPEIRSVAKIMDDDEETINAMEEAQNSVDDENLGTDGDMQQLRSLRRGQDRALQSKRKRQAQQVNKVKAEQKPKTTKQTKQFTKLLKDIQKTQDQILKCESEIEILDNDLREADCPRTRILGKDRFWNRYFWFERNGMPYGGLPNSSTAEAGYANGCIWVQGPDDIEREGFIDMNSEWQNEYKERFGMTVPERKQLEEGMTNLFSPHQWGFYDDPKALDSLISWLDVRGFNELKLHKELKLYRDRISSNMENRKKYLNRENLECIDPKTKVLSTHQKGPSPKYRCLEWFNSMALAETGHLHSEQPRLRRSTKKATSNLHHESEKLPRQETNNNKFKKPLVRTGTK
ncbi:hypothetical protein K3495_g3079 [Podosphaera aphanis]|nr:hypothetical protein K3495_g3079 [Podosphaera aphanis]